MIAELQRFTLHRLHSVLKERFTVFNKANLLVYWLVFYLLAVRVVPVIIGGFGAATTEEGTDIVSPLHSVLSSLRYILRFPNILLSK